MTDTAPCTKCNSDISTTIERCPECGYEPSASTLGTLFFLFCALPFTLLFGLGAVVAVLGTFSGMGVEGLGVVAVFGIFGLIPFWYTRRYLRLRNLKPTESL